MNNNFETYDLGLTAALVTRGFPLKDMDKTDPRKVIFTFERKGKMLDNSINRYMTDKLQVSARSYFDNLRALKNRIHDIVPIIK